MAGAGSRGGGTVLMGAGAPGAVGASRGVQEGLGIILLTPHYDAQRIVYGFFQKEAMSLALSKNNLD